MIRHMVMMRFAQGVTGAQKAAIYADLQALAGHLPGMLAFHSATNISPEEPVVHGFRDLFWIDFADAAARDAYLVDPGHQAIGGRIVALTGGVDGVQVVDFLL